MTTHTPLLSVLLLTACLNVTEERIARDLSVGERESAGVRVHVEDGRAAVRALDENQLELWANAPFVAAELDLSAREGSGPFRIRVRNALPDAELELADSDGTPLSLREVPTTFATERRVELDPPNARLHLALRTRDQDARTPFQFLAFADVQDAMPQVGDIFARMNQEADARFVMMAGDISERGRAEELERFQREQLALRIPIFVTLGNHELGTASLPYYEYFGRGSQSFTFHDARFTFLDSASATLDPTLYDWLDDWLDAGRGHAHFLFMHVPPVDPSGIRNGCFSSRAETGKFLAHLSRGELTAAFYGHVHSYYSFEHAGIPAFISGGGGAIPERFDGIGRHFLVVDVDPVEKSFHSRIVRVD